MNDTVEEKSSTAKPGRFLEGILFGVLIMAGLSLVLPIFGTLIGLVAGSFCAGYIAGRGILKGALAGFLVGGISGIGIIVLVALSYSVYLSILSIVGFFTGPAITIMYTLVCIGILLTFGILGTFGGSLGGLVKKMRGESALPDD